jgi:hypothetical protein
MNSRHHRLPLAAAAMLMSAAFFSAQMPAQQTTMGTGAPIGTVSAADADVSAPLQTIGGKVFLSASSTVTAHDHTAEVDLEHHGLALVCATTALQIHDSTNGGPLMLSIDRGAVELRIATHSGDVLTTPDLSIQPTSDGSLNLQLRVARNGDTCMENIAAAANAPTLEIHEQLGDGMYLLHPGQHVLFNYGSVHQVVDNETLPCGCPESAASLIADATPPKKGASKNPFPLAQSEGLTTTPPPPATKPGEAQVTLKATMHMNGDQPPIATAPPPPLPPQKTNFFGHIGHFFKKSFGGK